VLDDAAARGLRQGADTSGAGALSALPEPSRQLPPAARRYWRASAILELVGTLAALYAVRAGLDGADVVDLPGWLPLALAAVAGVVTVGIVPSLRWRRWRYEIRDEEIDLRHGAVVERRTVVPMRRVQHVDTSSGPLQGMFELATLTFHTAAGPVAVPALWRGEADAIRHRVSGLAQALDDV
jgi:membrane protein YdbS with pleckstrin-like domain